MALIKIEPYIIDSTGDFTFNNVTTTGSISSLSGLTVNNGSSTVNFSNTANVTLGNISNLHIFGGTNGQVLSTDGAGNLYWGAGGGGGGGGANISNGNSNVNIPTADGNVTVSVTGNSNVAVITGTGVNVNGYLNATEVTSGNANLGNNATANYFTGNLYGTANTAGTVTQNAQSNITSVGTLTGLTIGGISDLGPVGNVRISGGTNGYVLTTNGAGGLSWAVGGSGGVSNGNSNVSIPIANGNINFTAASNTSMIVTGTGANVFGTLTVTGLTTVANLTTSGGPGGNISNVNVISANTFLVSSLTVNNPTTGVIDFVNTANVSLGAVANLHISGGSNGYLLQTNGAGTLSWVTPPTLTTIANGNSNVSIPSSNGNVNISTAGNANIVVVTGTGVNVAGTLNVTGNSNVANIGGNIAIFTGNLTAGNIIAGTGNGGNISNANVISANTLTVLNFSSGNIYANSGTVGAATLNISGNANVGNLGFGSGLIIGTGNANVGILNASNAVTTGNVTATGNITASNIVAGGGAGGNITGANLVSANYFTGTLTTGSQPNITTIGTLGNLTVTTNSNLGNVATANYLTGTLTTGAQPNITAVGTLGNLTITGNITTGGNIISIGGAGGNITGLGLLSANLLTGALTTNAQPNITSVGTLTSLGVSGAVTAVSFTANTGVFTGNGSGLTALTGANVTGTVPSATVAATANGVAGANVSGQVGNALVAGYVYANAQANITSVGTLNGLTVNGPTDLGAVGNVTITGGTGGYYLQTNGFGVLSWQPVPVGSGISNGNSNINIPVAGGNIDFSAEGNANIFVITGTGVNVAGTLNTGTGIITGNGNGLSSLVAANIVGQVANSLISGTVYTNAQPNITSVGTLTSVTVTGNIDSTTGNLNVVNASLGNLAIANYFSGSGNNLSNIQSGNITGQVANALVASTVYTNAQPNITSVGTLTSLGVTGTITSGNANLGNLAIANYFSGSGNNLSNIQAGNITGQLANALVAGTVYTNAQPNITSVGTLTILDVTGNITSGNATLGNAATANYFIGSGNNLSNIQPSSINGQVANALIASTVYTNAQPNITSVGTLTSLDVTGNISSGNATLGNLVTANFFSGSGNNLSNIQAGNITGQLANALVAGTVYTNAQPNITSVGTLTSLIVAGNISSANANLGNLVIANFFSGSGNNLSNIQPSSINGQVANALVASEVYTNAQPNITSTGTLTSLNVSGTSAFGANINMGTHWINNVGYPSLSTDVATKAYVDTAISSGISYHEPVFVATTTTLATATGGTTAYVSPNGAANGIGAYISTTGTYLNIDSANVQTVGTRILVKDEANAAWNGIYTYANINAIVRATDADTYGPDAVDHLSLNDYFFTTNGTVNEGTAFIVSGPTGTITFGTSNITFSIFSTSQIYDAGTGISILNTTISIANTTVVAGSYGNGDRIPTYTVNQQGQLTAASNTIITANAANLTGTTLNSSVVTSSLTSVGSLGNLTVIGNLSSGNANLGNDVVANYFTGTLTTNAQPNITSVGTLTSLSVNSTITAVAFTANSGVFTGNGNGLSSIVGANVTGTVANATHASTANTVTTNAQPNITSVGTLTSLDVTGTVTAAAFTANTGIFTGNGNGLSQLVGANVTGTVANATHANIADTVTTNAQPNITSVGTLTSLSVSGNITGGNLVTTGKVYSADFINGGTGIYLAPGPGGYINFFTSTGDKVSIKDNGNIDVAGTANVGNLSTGGTLSATGNANVGNLGTGNIVATGTVTANAFTANTGVFTGNGHGLSQLVGANVTGTVPSATTATTAGTVTASAQPNITSLGTLTSLSVSGAFAAAGFTATTGVFAGNGSGLSELVGANVTGTVANATHASTANTVTTNAQPNITSVGSLTGLTVSGVSNLGPVGNVIITGGGPSFVLMTNGSGNLSWSNPTSYPVPGIDTQVVFNDGGTYGANSNFTFNKTTGTVTSTLFNGTLTTNAQPNITSVGTLTGLTVSGNVSTGNVSANIVTANFTNAVLTTNAQPNITSVGNLDSLNVTGTSNLGPVGNVIITGGSTGQYLQTNGSGILTWSTITITTNNINNGNSNVNISTAGGNVITSVDGNANILVVTGTGANVNGYANVNGDISITGNANITANISANNISSNTLTVSGTSNLGAVGNVTITGGTANYFLQTNGSGVLTWTAVPTGTNISNGTSNVDIPVASGNVNISAGASANVVVITSAGANITGTANITGELALGGNVSGANNISANTFTGNLTTNAQPNITSVGNLTSLDVTGNITGNVITVNNANLGNVVIANIFSGSGNGLSNIQGANVDGTVANANYAEYAGNVTASSQSNITSLGTLTGLTVSGNTDLGNVGNVRITGGQNGAALMTDGAGNLNWIYTAPQTSMANGNSSISVENNGNINISAVGVANVFVVTGTGSNITGTLNVSNNANTGNLGTNNFIATGTGSFGANVNMNTYWINNVGSPSLATDVATKSYVDNLVSSGISYHEPVYVATTTSLATATGGTTSYTQPGGPTVGIGAYISTTGTFLNIDGANVQTVGTRILVKDEANATWNGIYTYANSTAIIRSTDTDQSGVGNTELLGINDYFFTTNGSVNEGTAFVVSAPAGTITFGTSNITFAIFSTSQVYDAGTGLTLANTTFSISNTAVTAGSYGGSDTVATFTVNDQGQLTAASNTTITANAANLSGTTLNSAIVNSSLTSVGILTALDVNGNIRVSGNITANTNIYANSGTIGASLLTGTLTTSAQPNVTSVGTLTSLDVTGNLSAGNANLGNVVIANFFTGTLTTSAQPNITSTGTLTSLDVTGNLSAGNANLGNLVTANYVTGILTTSGQPNITTVGTLTTLAVVGSITSGNASLGNSVNGNYFIGSGNNLSNIQGGNVTGQVGNAYIAGTVYTNAQPNITSTGTLANLTVSSVANIVGGGATVATKAVLAVDSSFGSSDPQDPASAQAIRGRVTGANLTNTRNYITGVTGQYLVTGTNASEFIKAGVLGVVGDQTTTADGAVVAYLDGDGGLTTANAAYAVSMKNSTAGSGFNYGLDLQFINLNLAGVTSPYKQADIRFNNGVTLVANTTGNININANVTATSFIGAGNNLSNIQGSNVSGAVAFATTANSVAGANVSGQVANALIAGTIYTNAQPNITSTGTLTSVTVSGQSNLGNVGNVKITGGTNGYVLSTDGTGNLSWISQAPTSNIVLDSFTGNGVQTVFTLSTTPASENYTIINIDGVSQLHTSYNISGTDVTLSSAPAVGSLIEVMVFNLAGGGSGGVNATGPTYLEATANTNASANTKYIVDTDSANITITLPSSPTLGTQVGIIDGTGNASIHAITIDGNGGNIQGSASSMVVTTNRSALTLVYYNVAQGWILTN